MNTKPETLVYRRPFQTENYAGLKQRVDLINSTRQKRNDFDALILRRPYLQENENEWQLSALDTQRNRVVINALVEAWAKPS